MVIRSTSWIVLGLIFSFSNDEISVPKPAWENEAPHVTDLAFSPNAKYFATADSRGSISLWNAKSLEKVRHLENPGHVHAIAFSLDGSLLAAVTELQNRLGLSAETTVRLWSIPDGKLEHIFKITDDGQNVASRFYSVAFSSEEKLLITLSGNHTDSGELLTLWNLQDKTLYWQAKFPSQANARSLCLDEKGRRAVTCGTDGISAYSDLKVWDWNQKQLKHDLKGKAGPVYAVACSPDGKIVVSGGERVCSKQRPAELIIWDLHTGKKQQNLSTNFRGRTIIALDFTSDGKYLVLGDMVGEVAIWDMTDLTKVVSWKGYNHSLKRLALSNDGRVATLGSDGPLGDRVIRIWDLQTVLRTAKTEKK